MAHRNFRSTRRRNFAIDGLRFAWNGGHTVNVFAGDRNIDCFSVGDFAKDHATLSQVIRGIDSYIAAAGVDPGGSPGDPAAAVASVLVPVSGATIVSS